jgi:hypothetical protein
MRLRKSGKRPAGFECPKRDEHFIGRGLIEIRFFRVKIEIRLSKMFLLICSCSASEIWGHGSNRLGDVGCMPSELAAKDLLLSNQQRLPVILEI